MSNILQRIVEVKHEEIAVAKRLRKARSSLKRAVSSRMIEAMALTLPSGA